MKKPWLLFAGGCVALWAVQVSTKKHEGALGGKAAAGATAEDQAIGRIAEDWRNAYNGGDASKVAALYVDRAPAF